MEVEFRKEVLGGGALATGEVTKRGTALSFRKLLNYSKDFGG